MFLNGISGNRDQVRQNDKKKIKDHHDLVQQGWITKNKTLSFYDFYVEVEKHNQGFQILVNVDKRSIFVLLHDLQLNDEYSGPKIKFCIKVDNDLKVFVWINGIRPKVLRKSLLQLNFSNECIFLWSQ